MSVSRRGVVKGGAAGALSIALAGSLDTIFQTSAGAEAGAAFGYGPLVPDPKGVLDLPKGFSYKALSAEGDTIGAGVLVPGRHDGMATFAGSRRDTLRLVRNHEQTASGVKPVAPAPLVYDPAAYGGTTTLEVDRNGDLVRQEISLAGTSTNCAGGRTPWGTWLTCEETEGFTGQTKSHGWVFEVDPTGRRTRPEPITGMGRFAHEAVAVDPHTHVAYLTEDASKPFGLFYRFTPRSHRSEYHAYMAGGRLDAMYVPDLPDLSVVQEPGATFRVTWVKVPDPSAAATSTRKQFDKITRSQKLEGAWWGHGKAYFVASYSEQAAGAAADHAGQVWKYDPRKETIELELVFKPGGRFDGPDNITVSPYGGGVILAEDGDGEQYLVGTTRKGEPFAFARNAFNDSEMCGVTFSPDGRTLFASRQSPGVTFAITGPWHRVRA
ncbi:PhoX family protein [Actinomadura viridis]|uniref:Secreted PhoX family phosphatase n=1 Tax=Actinomadura viridis TaxID=58110 RepID=A0A931DA80_9ACTN|nr:alkaline phosphatase PhoX [Actinomadura viridis]MBG6087344.1 secreted PhoX family phosphatase [Actinomadura viridis]